MPPAGVITADDAVDYDFNAIKHQLAQEIAEEDPARWTQRWICWMVIKYLERIGDHAVNVAEWGSSCAPAARRREHVLMMDTPSSLHDATSPEGKGFMVLTER